MTEPARTLRLSRLDRAPFVALFLAGLALRLPGVLFNGMADIYQILLDWGFSVWKNGLVATFGINYGALSYAAFGLVVRGAEQVPRFWWATYKLLIIGVDVALLFALLRLVPRSRRTLVIALYWLNPWFALHEAYHGFWESPHLLFGVLAASAVIKAKGARWGWAAAGALLVCSAMLKPQGLLYFIVPVGIYLSVQWLRGYRAALHWWIAGAAGTVAMTSLYFWVGGGSGLAVVENYRSAFTSMSGVSNGGPGIWRFFSYTYGVATGQHGHVAFIRMPRILIGAVSAAAALACVAIFLAFGFRVAPTGVDKRRPVDDLIASVVGPFNVVQREPGELLLLVMALGSLAMSQFGVRAHINHSYTAVVLLIPLVATHASLFRPWAALTGLLAISHVLIFVVGGPGLLPPESILHTYPAAAGLIAKVQGLPAYGEPDTLLVFQQRVWDTIHRLPVEAIVSLLSPLVFVVACWLVVKLFEVATAASPSQRPAR